MNSKIKHSNQNNTSYILLDGGMGRELKKRLPNFDPILWSATGLIEDPDAVVNVHCDYINAGSTIITTNNYTVVPSILQQVNRSDELGSLTQLAGKLAQSAVKKTGNTVKVAGSIPPLASSYRPDLVVDQPIGIKSYTAIAQNLLPYIDVFLCESMSSIPEAFMAVTALQPFNKPIWVSFILDDHSPDQILSEDKINQITQNLDGLHYDALLFNCAQPYTISQGLALLETDKLKGGYANSFQKLPSSDHHVHGNFRPDEPLSPEDYFSFVSQWRQNNATIIGGCCGIGPEHINYIYKQLR